MLRFLSIVSEDFWPGFAALVQSIAENGAMSPDSYEFRIICDVDSAPRAWLEERRERIELVPMDILPRLSLLSAQNQGPRMEKALQKLGVFALPSEWGVCVYIDSDMICVGSLIGLNTFQPLTAAADVPLLSEDLHAAEPPRPGLEFNTGLLVFRPDERIFEELLDVYQRRHHERTHKGDQDIFNLWVREQGASINLIGSEWNFGKRYQDTLGSRRCRSLMPSIKLMHYVGIKPWTENMHVTTFRECHYRWMEEIWWDYFERSGLPAHLSTAPQRATAFRRQWVLPWSKPEILKEHRVRALRLLRKCILSG